MLLSLAFWRGLRCSTACTDAQYEERWEAPLTGSKSTTLQPNCSWMARQFCQAVALVTGWLALHAYDRSRVGNAFLDDTQPSSGRANGVTNQMDHYNSMISATLSNEPSWSHSAPCFVKPSSSSVVTPVPLMRTCLSGWRSHCACWSPATSAVTGIASCSTLSAVLLRPDLRVALLGL